MSKLPETTPLYSLWNVQDSLLQYYRTMFLTAESLLIAVTASIATVSKPPALALAAIGLVVLAVWSRVTRARARDVHFTQELIKWHEAGRCIAAPLTIFKQYQGQWRKTGQYTVQFLDGTSEEFVHEGVWPPRESAVFEVWNWSTRLQMEVVLPAVYLLSWAAIVTYAITRP